MLNELTKARHAAKLLREAFPDETLKPGQKLKVSQVEKLNAALEILK